MQKTMSKAIILFLLTTGAHLCFASGGDYGGGYQQEQRSQEVDHSFERGKALLTGRHPSYKKVKFCLKDSESQKMSKIKRKNIKAYKNGPINTMTADIYRCDDASANIQQVLDKNELIYAVYYLNKRYKLNLK